MSRSWNRHSFTMKRFWDNYEFNVFFMWRIRSEIIFANLQCRPSMLTVPQLSQREEQRERERKYSCPCNRPWRPIGLWDVEADVKNKIREHTALLMDYVLIVCTSCIVLHAGTNPPAVSFSTPNLNSQSSIHAVEYAETLLLLLAVHCYRGLRRMWRALNDSILTLNTSLQLRLKFLEHKMSGTLMTSLFKA
jgi:hypothetical protein